ncbi:MULTISPECIES: FAD:protein FMN transferase [Halocynthiibacter]|uniref:FAD:protein FMN transferase n=1 Tax=Halocynthiibacter halioticoli TaxID=2986804 RepID=A0AAE3IWK5_9RHOB|nr:MULTISPECIES: FAD:protein FMN transferase [Halocynthiibacter]MCV6823413.1 FAD:protein FMN transferase [Halocynthiibacter halioticoli]MCW4056414.1 FAD:protein FMN transferase [Halocynthiibacter sp. SDUM655004]
MITRRRMLSILAGATALPLAGTATANTQTWRGVALGAEARIVLDHPKAETLLPLAVSEIHRLEHIFSLYQNYSELSRLNRQGKLTAPSQEMVELLSIVGHVHTQTEGAFDPTIQPLWALYAQSYAKGAAPTEAEIQTARSITGWNNIRFDSAQVSFNKLGMALTLNGIAQGYIADKVAALLRANGVHEALVNTGEIVGLGDWPVQTPAERLALSNQAVATSAIRGTGFDQAGKVGHILDPRTGLPATENNTVSVLSQSAAIADGLSTGFCILPRDKVEAAIRNMPDGSRVIFG